MLLRRFNIVNYVKQDTQWTTAPPILQVFYLNLMLLCIVVKRFSINSKHNRLTYEIKRMRRAAETTMEPVELVHIGEFGDSAIVCVGVVEYEVSNL